MTDSKLLDQPDLERAAYAFRVAAAKASAYDVTLSLCLDVFGKHGPIVSGIGRDHFPDEYKRLLRQLARDATDATNHAYTLRPRGVHEATMRKVAQAVARKYETGFYGPQGWQRIARAMRASLTT